MFIHASEKSRGYLPVMTVRRALILLLFTALVLPSAGGQDEIKKKQSQLERLRNEIDKYESRIKEREKKEHSTLELLDTYDRQSTLLRKLITKLHEQETSLQDDIDSTKRSIAALSGRLSYLKNHYAHYVMTTYKFGRTYDLELLLSSKSFNQLLIRSEYLKRFSNQRKKDLDKIDNQRSDVEEENQRLERQLAEQQELIKEKSNEEAKLAAKMKKRKLMLTDIRKDKKNFKREISRKIEAAKDMEQLIAKLIEQDRIKKERESRKSSKPPERESTAGSGFESKRGHLRWPVASGKVVARFGAQQNPVLHTITQNTGIDISVPSGTTVTSIADGEVSTIWWLPSFGNLVILDHKNGFRSVYAHLSEISVNEGEKIMEGGRIGKSGEALSGPLLHFELWKERDKQDPERWLQPRGLAQH
jgi:septal ring factor EnvC (AmiA/AmiB activator)